MGAGDQYVLRSHLDQTLGAHVDSRLAFVLVALGQAPGFRCVGGDQRGLRQQHFAHGGNDFLAGQFVATSRGQHGVENERDLRVVGNDFGNGQHILDTAQHADLESGDRHVFKDGTGLLLDQFGTQRLHALHANGILNGDRGQCGKRVATKAGQCEQVGLNAGTRRGIAGSKNKNQRRAGRGGGGGVH